MSNKIRHTNKFVKRAAVSALAAALASGYSLASTAQERLDREVQNPLPQSAQMVNRIIIKYRDAGMASLTASQAHDRIEAASAMAGAELTFMHETAGNADVMALSQYLPVAEVKAMAEHISTDPDVLYAEPDYILHAHAIPDDPLYERQWHYFEPAGGINLPDALDVSTGNNVVVAVIDSGISPHQDLNGQLVAGYDFISAPEFARDGDGFDADFTDEGTWKDPGTCGPQDNGANSDWHGTHVAGTVAASSHNGFGVAGVAWNARIQPVRVLGTCGGNLSDIATAMLWSAGLPVPGAPQNPTPAKVLNLSLGGPGQCPNTFLEAIEAVRQAGATVVVSAGNDNADASQYMPASCPGVITVAANKRDGGRAYYSNFGEVVDITAPGGEIIDPVRQISTQEDGVLSTLNTGTTVAEQETFAYYQGTSMAAPHVAGVAALMYAINPDLRPDEVESILTTTARSFPAVAERTCDTTLCGAGILDAFAAVNEVGDVPPGATGSLQNGVPVTDIAASQDDFIVFQMEVPAGATNLTFSISGGQGDADLYVKFAQPPSLQDFDYRPFLEGNTETVTVEAVQAGTYYVALHGYAAFSGVTLVGQFEGGRSAPEPREPADPVTPPDSNTYLNDTDVAIIDGSGVASAIDIPVSRDAGVFTLDVDIKHGNRGELQVGLVAPGGQSALLKDFDASDTEANLSFSVQIDASGVEAQGQWNLVVIDGSQNGVTGFIDSWSMTFE